MQKQGCKDLGFAQGHATVKWQNQELIQVWVKRITFRKVEKGGTGFPYEGKNIIMGTGGGHPRVHMEKIEWFILPGACIE